MNTKSRRRSVALLTALLIVGANAASESIAPVNPMNRVPTASTKVAWQSAIEVQLAKIRELQQILRSLEYQLTDLNSMRPEEPRREQFNDEASYQRALAAYRASLDAWQSQMQRIQKRISEVQHRLRREEQILASMRNEETRTSQQVEQVASTDTVNTVDKQSAKASHGGIGSGQSPPLPPPTARSVETLEFDPLVDEELADAILEREAELSDVQARGSLSPTSRARILGTKSSRTSVSAFRQKTAAFGLQDTIVHVAQVADGAKPRIDFVAQSILQSAQAHPDQDIMSLLYAVFRESIQQQNRDKTLWIAKLRDHNRSGQAMSEYLKELNDMVRSGGLDLPDSDSGSRCGDDAEPTEAELSLLDPDHRELARTMLAEKAWRSGDEGIRRTIRQLQQMEAEVRNRRQLAISQFENANQKLAQLMNMLSSVMKTMKEMESGIIRNMR